jgi:hypothetical protein
MVEKLQVSKQMGRRSVEKECEVQVATEPHMVGKRAQLRRGWEVDRQKKPQMNRKIGNLWKRNLAECWVEGLERLTLRKIQK